MDDQNPIVSVGIRFAALLLALSMSGVAGADSAGGQSTASSFDAYDIAGLKLGMTLAEIRDVLQKNGVRSISEYDSQLSYQDEVKSASVAVPNTRFKTAFWARDGVGTYSIFFSPESGHERPIQIRYLISLDADSRISETAFIASVSAKYGSPVANGLVGASQKRKPVYVGDADGPHVLAWGSDRGAFAAGVPNSCYAYAMVRHNELSPNDSRVNNPVFDVTGNILVGNVSADCGSRYLLIEYFAKPLPDPTNPILRSGKQLVTGYVMTLVDARASIDSMTAASQLSDAAKRGSLQKYYNKAEQAAPPKL